MLRLEKSLLKSNLLSLFIIMHYLLGKVTHFLQNSDSILFTRDFFQ